MGLFNIKKKKKTTYNLAGGEAYAMTPELNLATMLLTSFVKDQYYRSAEDSTTALVAAASACDPLFAAKAAVFARNAYGMRSASHLMAVDLSKRASGTTWAKGFYYKIVRRPDDMTEIMAGVLASGAKSPTNAMKKGFAKAFDKFDAYQLAKYRGESKTVKLVDVVNLVRPIPTDKNAKALKELVSDTLRSTNTWEAKLTNAGQKATSQKDKAERKAAAWADLLKSNKLGYFALLRNLSNILTQAPELADLACERLTNEKAIRKSLVLPFRYLSAIDEVQKLNAEGTLEVLYALDEAVDIACSNVPKFHGKTLVVLDDSGSMDWSSSAGKSPAEIGALFAAVLVKSNAHCDFMQFSDNARYYTMNRRDSTLGLARSIKFQAGGTNFHSIFETANKCYDRIIILSDMQGWVGGYAPTEAHKQYCKKYRANPYIYSIDLQGYGSTQFPEHKVFCLAGFSEKIFELMAKLEEDPRALIHEINSVRL